MELYYYYDSVDTIDNYQDLYIFKYIQHMYLKLKDGKDDLYFQI